MEPLWSPVVQPVATGRKSRWRPIREIKPKPLPPVATGCRSERMVRRGSTDACVVYASSRRRRVQRSLRWLSAKTTRHPAPIPHEVPADSRQRTAIPAKPRWKRPARAGNPRLSPPTPERPRPARRAERRARLGRCAGLKGKAPEATAAPKEASPAGPRVRRTVGQVEILRLGCSPRLAIRSMSRSWVVVRRGLPPPCSWGGCGAGSFCSTPMTLLTR